MNHRTKQYMHCLFKFLKATHPPFQYPPPNPNSLSFSRSLPIPSPSIQPCTTESLHDRPNQTNKAGMLEISQHRDVLSYFMSLVNSNKWWPCRLILHPPSSSRLLPSPPLHHVAKALEKHCVDTHVHRNGTGLAEICTSGPCACFFRAHYMKCKFLHAYTPFLEWNINTQILATSFFHLLSHSNTKWLDIPCADSVL